MTSKNHLSFQDQAKLLAERTLKIDDVADCEAFLSRVNYYRFSGYTRYFQTDPGSKDNGFREATSFNEIRQIYDLDQELRNICIRALALAESSLRTQFAYFFSKNLSPETFLDEATFVTSNTQGPVTESILRDLDRSKEPFVAHFRTIDVTNPNSQPTYPSMPVWAGVETMSFGTLSKCLERMQKQDVTKEVAQNSTVAWAGFTSQVKSFVYLRNRCAHLSRLWNHSVIDAPHIPNNITARAKRIHGQYDPRSIFAILVGLDNFLDKAGLQTGLLKEIETLTSQCGDFNQGIKKPTKPTRVDTPTTK